ncbi:MAG: type IV secretion system protein [Pseudomonadota bacterium]|nr:type IV secretion system protein [Gammaproteobacteria bacterium]MBU1558589.1 type IV secretion system protein [Gammaproteobacteria bacterium]MBU1629183.1 type IV secretion system protein [Gammaproteobacteria bacterium]MBU1927078.1 type IV secretion system protein [Gammaproteobacteria bacterium]MBU2546534.1 type IV secretion system protein [Gammaproteobacteria bacterium]
MHLIYTTIIEQLFIELDLLLKDFVFNGYTSMANALRYPLALAMTIYIVFLGISISQGWVKLSMSVFVKSVLKLGVIYTLAMNWGFFSSYVVHLISDGASQLGSILADATPIPLPHFAGEGINGAMQSVLIEFTRVGSWIWDMGSFHNLSPYITAIIMWIFEYALMLVAVFEIVIAKVMLAILFATAPLFVGFTLFKPTQNFFTRWLGAIVGYALMLLFISAVLALVLSLSQWAVEDSYIHKALHISFVAFVPAMFSGFIGLGIITRVTELALSIGNMVTLSTGAAAVTGGIGAVVGGGLSVLKMPLSGAGYLAGKAGEAGKGLFKLLGKGAFASGKSLFNMYRESSSHDLSPSQRLQALRSDLRKHRGMNHE